MYKTLNDAYYRENNNFKEKFTNSHSINNCINHFYNTGTVKFKNEN